MSYEPQQFSEWFAKLPIKAERSTAELSWRTAWSESEKYSESLYVEMIAGRDKRIAVLTEALRETKELVCVKLCSQRSAHRLACVKAGAALALANEQSAGNAGGTGK